MNVIIQKKQVYGNTVYYPVNDAAKALASIAGTATLTMRTILIARDQLGAKIELLQEVFS